MKWASMVQDVSLETGRALRGACRPVKHILDMDGGVSRCRIFATTNGKIFAGPCRRSPTQSIVSDRSEITSARRDQLIMSAIKETEQDGIFFTL